MLRPRMSRVFFEGCVPAPHPAKPNTMPRSRSPTAARPMPGVIALPWATVLTPEEPGADCASAEAEDELGVVGHPVRRPGGVERQLELDVLDALDLADGAVDVLRDQRAGGTAHGGQGVRDLRGRVLHRDLVEQAEVDDVHPELGILDL